MLSLPGCDLGRLHGRGDSSAKAGNKSSPDIQDRKGMPGRGSCMIKKSLVSFTENTMVNPRNLK